MSVSEIGNPEELVLAVSRHCKTITHCPKLFPLSLIWIRLPGLSHLDIDWFDLIEAQPIHLSSFRIADHRRLCTSQPRNCSSSALQTLLHLKYVKLSWCDDIESALLSPRSVKVDLVPSNSVNNYRAGYHMREPELCCSVCNIAAGNAFSWLSREYDEGLLLHVLRQSQDVSRFSWIIVPFRATSSAERSSRLTGTGS